MDETITVRSALNDTGAHLMPPDAVRAQLAPAAEGRGWERFAAHWASLAPDPYASEQGTRRQRRYGQFLLHPASGELRRLPHVPFVQPDDSNPLYVQVDRHFEPLTDAFADDPVLHAFLFLLGRLAEGLDPTTRDWSAKVHPFRVMASGEGGEGSPTPEGRHRDGVTLVSSLLVSRANASGGRSTVYTPDGHELLATTLDAPGALLVADDRRTLHSVSPIRPVDPSAPALRDVLVATLAPA
ncbi:2OG-Fe dioxygenase family protein [Streptomyces sp. RS10V-4]|uniref:2OG-Fe dioxygenase family protein n=1 Tax=Streptomyces rhizoryzae TaxID=2932493 RepID=UPI002005ED3A|nr:2OG-Fe dioxygenase family protein [Streptomyces rhizoryzae]MCK7624397.1 2OG-Fe dioxygenase family protein [Streptomyces rhizoryzae]